MKTGHVTLVCDGFQWFGGTQGTALFDPRSVRISIPVVLSPSRIQVCTEFCVGVILRQDYARGPAIGRWLSAVVENETARDRRTCVVSRERGYQQDIGIQQNRGGVHELVVVLG
jgi:hypothetical protein